MPNAKISPVNLTIQQACDACLVLRELIIKDAKDVYVLPSAVKIRMSNIYRELSPVYENYIEKRDALIKKLGAPVQLKEGEKPSENPQFIIEPSSPNWAEYEKENKEMLAAPADVSFTPIPAEQFSDSRITTVTHIALANAKITVSSQPEEEDSVKK